MSRKKEINKKIKSVKYLLIVLTLVLVGKLGIVAIYYNEEFQEMAKYQTSVTIDVMLPRGEVFDVNGEQLLGNELQKKLMYVEPGLKSNDEKYESAAEIAALVEVDPEELTDENIKTLWLNEYDEDDTMNLYNVMERLTDAENEEVALNTENEEAWKNDEIYLKKVTDKEVELMETEHGREVLYIKMLMSQATSKTPVEIKGDLTRDEQYAIESKSDEVGSFYVTDGYERTYPQDDLLKSFLGLVGPIPEENIDIYESKGYASDELVGTSYLEEALEPVLRSTPQSYQVYFDEKGNIVNMIQSETGVQGNDVKLTLDVEMQKIADATVVKQLSENNYKYNTEGYAMVSDPETGNVLALSGQIEEGDEYYENSVGNINSAFVLGSVVKPAALLMGYDIGVIDEGKIYYDEPLHIAGSNVKASAGGYARGNIDEIEALADSSNVYFYKLFLDIAGEKYEEDAKLDISSNYFDLVRRYYEMFGLGSTTGFGMGESPGLTGADYLPGFYLDLANGQYDTYSGLQFNQYITTLANGGTRYSANYVDSVYTAGEQGEYGTLVYQQSPEVLSNLPMSDDEIDYMKLGMDACYETGTGEYDGFKGLPVPASCKTGTAESFYPNDEGLVIPIVHSTSMAYAPQKNPDVVVDYISPYYDANLAVQNEQASAKYLKDLVEGFYKLYPEELED